MIHTFKILLYHFFNNGIIPFGFSQGNFGSFSAGKPAATEALPTVHAGCFCVSVFLYITFFLITVLSHWDFSHGKFFQLLEVKLESCVFRLTDSFRRMWKVIISKSWSLPMSAPGELCVLAMFTPDWKRLLTKM